MRYWQCENEPSNAGLLWAGNAAEYVTHLHRFAVSVRSADPAALVVLGGCGYDVLSSPKDGPARRFFAEVTGRARDDFDLLDVHLYDDPHRIPAHVETVRGLTRAHGYQRPVVAGEYNGPTILDFPAATGALERAMAEAFAAMPTADAPVDMDTSVFTERGETPVRRAMRSLYEHTADLPWELRMFMSEAPPELANLRDRVACRQLAQRVVLAAAAGVRTMMCWQLAPEVPDYTDPLNLMDLLFGRLALMDHVAGEIAAPRPAGRAHRTIAAHLAGSAAVERIPVDDDVHLYRITRSDHADALVAWLRTDDPLAEAESTRSVTAPWPAGDVRLIDVFGETRDLAATDGTVELAVTATPVFVTAAREP